MSRRDPAEVTRRHVFSEKSLSKKEELIAATNAFFPETESRQIGLSAQLRTPGCRNLLALVTS
jgi:hypothetical protein